jgi:histone acetyltransferase
VANASVVPDYLEVIKEPIDLSTIEKRIRANYYKSRKMLYADLILMVNNCKLYNDDGSTYVQCAVALEKMVTTNLFADVLEGTAGSTS